MATANEQLAAAIKAAAEETSKQLQFQQEMEMLKQSNQILNPASQQNRLTTNCR